MLLLAYAPKTCATIRKKPTANSRATGTSFQTPFEAVERAALKAQPVNDDAIGEWRQTTLHTDCYVLVGRSSTAPNIHRHKKLRIKFTENHVEIFSNLERLAIHPRSRHRGDLPGERFVAGAALLQHNPSTQMMPIVEAFCMSPGYCSSRAIYAGLP